MNMNPRKTIPVVAFSCMITIVGMPKAIAQCVQTGANVTIGGFEVIDLDGVNVLRDPETGTMSNFNIAATVSCNSWSSDEIIQAPDTESPDDGTTIPNTVIGGVKVNFEEPGFYKFNYKLEPWFGSFFSLEGGQVVLIKDLRLDGMSVLDDEQMQRFTYSYNPSEEIILKIPEPGTYIIGFGPYNGTLLPESLAAQEVIPNAPSIQFQLARFIDPNSVAYDGFELEQLVDLAWSEDIEGRYMITPIIKDGNYTLQDPRILETYFAKLNVDPKMTPGKMSSIRETWLGAMNAGYGPAQPFGRNAAFALGQLEYIGMVFANDQYAWNDPDIREVTAAKIGLYLWELQGKTEDSCLMVNDLLESRSYEELISIVSDEASEQLPAWFPEYNQ